MMKKYEKVKGWNRLGNLKIFRESEGELEKKIISFKNYIFTANYPSIKYN